jgi:hypothetical protein
MNGGDLDGRSRERRLGGVLNVVVDELRLDGIPTLSADARTTAVLVTTRRR